MKKPTSPFLVFCLIIFSLQSYSQTTFRYSYNVASFDIAGGMVETPTGDFVVAGLNSTFVPFFGNVFKLDNTGTVTWAKSYTGGIATNFTDIKNVSTGGYIVTGSSSNGGAVLVRLDVGGNVTWAKRYQLPDKPGKASTESGNAVIETSDGGFLVGGSVDYFWDGVSANTVDTTSAMAFKVDANGTLTWNRVWTITNPTKADEHVINDVAESADGYFFVGESADEGQSYDSDGDLPRNALVIKTAKADGALTYIRRWGAGNSSSQGINSAKTLSTGNILLGGYDDVHSFIVSISGTGTGTPTVIFNKRLNGAVFGSIYVVNDVMENSDGNYSLIGTQIGFLSFALNTMIVKINSTAGTVMFGRSYAPIGLTAILPEGGLASDQGYYVTMTDQQAGGFNYNVIRTDNTGQLGTGATGCNSTSLNPALGTEAITFSTPTTLNYTTVTESAFAPTVNNLTPTTTQHCLNTACVPPATATTVTATPSTICAGETTSITASGAATGVTYNVYTDASAGTLVGAAPVSVSPGVTTIYYVETAITASPTCVSTTRIPVTVTVTPLPTPAAGSNSPICVGTALNLTSSGGTTYSWSGPNSFSSTAQNPSIPAPTTAASGTYTVTATTSGCSATATVTVTVNTALPATSGSNTPVCEGTTINLTASGGTDYSWAGPNSFTSTSQNPTLTATSAAAGTYTVTVTSGSCSATSTTTVAITPPPTATSGSNTPVCENGTINLTSGGGTSYAWAGPNGFTDATQNPTLTATAAAAGTYTVTVTDAGCSATAVTTVVITPLPVATAGVDTTFCENGTINLTSTGGGTYSWAGPNSFTSTSQNPTLAASAAAAGTYTVTVTASGCSATSATTVAITPAPIVTTGSNSPVCAGTAINLTSGGGTSYSWTGPNGFTDAGQNPTIASASALNAGTYTVTVTSSGCSATGTTTVAVTSGPTAIVGSNTPVCENSTVNLTASGGSTYSWSGPDGFTSASQNPTLTATTAAAGTYTVVVSVSGCSVIDSTIVAINPLPVATAGNTGSTICSGNVINLTASGGTGYSWAGPNSFTSTSQNPAITGATTAASGTYTVTVTGANSCSATATTSVTVNATPGVSISGTTTICSGSSTTLTAAGANSYLWNTGAITAAITVNPSTGTSYTVTGTSTAGCSSTQVVTVNVTTPPVAAITGTTSVCAGGSTTLTASGGGPYLWSTGETTQSITVSPGTATSYSVTVGSGCTSAATASVTVNSSPSVTITGDATIIQGTSTILSASGGTSYSWNPPTGLSCTNCATPEATPLVTTQYCVTATNAGGCYDSACVFVVVDVECGELFIPTAFSPNNDGENDMLYVMGGCIQDLNFAIFDRWGEKVFETSDPTLGWDGTYKGKVLDAAVFVYYLKAKVKGSDVSKHGNITLVK